MNTDLELRAAQAERAIVQLTNEQLRFIASTEFVPVGLRGNLPAIMACVATGRALGIDDMAALRTIHVIDGRPTYSAELMVMLVRRAGHSIVGKSGAGVAVVTGTRRDNGDTITVEWSLAMAERAGLAGKANWRKYPESMLWARAVSQLCRMLFADVFAGGTYTSEEVEQIDDSAHVVDHQDVHHVDEVDDQDVPEPLRPGPADDPDMISPKQRGRLWTISQRFGWSEERLRDLVESYTGQRSTTPIPRAVYEELVAVVESSLPVVEPDVDIAFGEELPIPDDVRAQIAADVEAKLNEPEAKR